MPFPVAAAITAGATLAQGVLGGKGNNRAIKTQDAAARRAEAIAIDNEKRRREEYDRQEAAAKAQWDAEQARLEPYRAAKNALLGQAGNRMGLNLGALGGARTATAYPGSAAAAQAYGTIGNIAGQPQAFDESFPEIQAAPRLSIADIANWGSQRRTA